MAINQKALTRISDGLKKFQPLVTSAKSRDINESDTVVLLTDILSDVLGYDKYKEITTEYAIRGTFCDLAIKLDGKPSILIEAKAVSVELKEPQVKQAVDYAANAGVEWVILTNAVNWKVYKIIFSKPIKTVVVCDFDFLNLKHKSANDLELVSLLCKEAVCKSALEDYFTQKQAASRFMIGNLLCEDSVLHLLRKELKTIFPNVKVTTGEILDVITKDVLKRDIFEGEEATEAKKKIAKANKRVEKIKSEKIKESQEIQVTENIDKEN